MQRAIVLDAKRGGYRAGNGGARGVGVLYEIGHEAAAEGVTCAGHIHHVHGQGRHMPLLGLAFCAALVNVAAIAAQLDDDEALTGMPLDDT